MTFDLRAILIFCIAAVLYNLLPARWRGWALVVGSVVAIYWLQPALPIRFSDFILPTATLVLTVALWWFTRGSTEYRVPGAEVETSSKPAVQTTRYAAWLQQINLSREDWLTLAVMAALVVGLSFMRFVEAEYRLTPSRPPEPLAVTASLVVMGALVTGISAGVKRSLFLRQHFLSLLIVVIVVIFAALKTGPLAAALSGIWRGMTGQDTSLASINDLNWLGFSYVAFRLIHTVRDRQTGLLPALTLRKFVTYVIFFPAYTAGPIDRAEHFSAEFKALGTEYRVPNAEIEAAENAIERQVPLVAIPRLEAGRWVEGGTRIMTGLLKKFIIADALSQGMALNAANAAQSTSTPGLWLLLYGYALRLFFDFSGYSDIAIGIGILFEIRLPENFDRPYLRTSITAFWQSWHMTLSNWARFYVFSPLTRWLLKREPKPSSAVIVLLTQLATMIVIGLWHGVTLNFVIWGVWQGLGLFLHKQWSDRTRKWYRELNQRPARKRAWTVFAWFVTFQYVVLGWVWFALPDTGEALRVFGKLFGVK